MANRISAFLGYGGEKSAESTALSSLAVNWKKDREIVAWAQRRWQGRHQRRRAFEYQWYVNIAQVLGLQYHIYDQTASRFRLPPAPPHRVRLVCNRLLPVVKKRVAKFLRQRPVWTTIPATNDPEDQQRSTVSTQVLQAYWRQLGMDEKLVEAVTWLAMTGNVFIGVHWDPNKGPPLTLSPEDIARVGPDAQKIMKSGLRLGDLTIEVVPPFEGDPDPQATTMESARDFVRTRLRTVEEIAEEFGSDAVKGIELREGASDSGLSHQERIRTMTMHSPFSSGEPVSGDHVLQHSIEVRPSKAEPNGVYAIVAGGKVLYKGPLPNSYGDISYVHLTEIMIPGRFWGTCAVEHGLPLQADYNLVRSQVVESRNLMTRPKWSSPRHAKIGRATIDSECGEVIEYTGNQAPEQIQCAPLPEYVHRSMEYDLRDLEDITSVHEVSQARAPSGVRSGTAIGALQEADDSDLAPTYLLLEKGLGKIGSWALQLLSDNVQEERIVKIVGENRSFDVTRFTGSDLKGSETTPGINYFDVEVQLGSQLPSSRAQRTDYILNLVDRGIFDRVADRKKIHNALSLGREEAAFDDDELDRQNARRENELILTGDPSLVVMPQPWDNDDIHYEEHLREQKRPNFIKNDPEAIARHVEHTRLHVERKQQAMMAAQAGGPGNPEDPAQASLPSQTQAQ